MIPLFPDFVPIALEHKAEVDTLLARLQPQASEYTFTNLFAWAATIDYRLARYGDGLLIRKGEGEHCGFLQPLVPGDGGTAVSACLDFLAQAGAEPRIVRVGEDFLARTTLRDATAREDRDNFDYVYSVPELTELRGDQYHDKKNLLNQFLSHNTYRYITLSQEMADRSVRFQHDWCAERECEKHESLSREDCATHRMLCHFGALHLLGGAIEIDGQIVALTLGEALNADTFVIHIEKAKAGITGLYQAINREFLAHAATAYPFVNREQDLGVPGLRKAKLSYNPVRMEQKYLVER